MLLRASWHANLRRQFARLAAGRNNRLAARSKGSARSQTLLSNYQLANDRYKLRPMTRLRTFGHVVNVLHMGGLGSYIEAEVKTWGHGCDIWHVRDGQPLITGGVYMFCFTMYKRGKYEDADYLCAGELTRLRFLCMGKDFMSWTWGLSVSNKAKKYIYEFVGDYEIYDCD